MCGRFSLFAPPDDVTARFDADFAFEYEPRYNAAPGQALPVIADEAPDTIRRMEWGLVPGWAENRSDFEFINARAETVAEKRSFAGAYEQRRHRERDDEGGEAPTAGRCLVPADGFYEWTERAGGNQPYRVTVGDDELFAMAGLWERWEPPRVQTGLADFGGAGGSGGAGEPGSERVPGVDPDPDPVETFTVITTEPNDVVGDLHDRMAVVLEPDEEEAWLRGDPGEVRDLLDPYPAEQMRAYPVSTAVSDPANDSPAVVEEVDVGT
ncbi:MAG: SOS response-associated peptidase [Haloarculaceae archaeon]